jgi:hypothetical protein
MRYLDDAGFEASRFRPLPPDPSAQGPTLFAVAATRRSTNTRARSRTSASPSIPTTADEGESR